jgi:hypothetical protein
MQRGSRQVGDRRLQRVQTVVKWQQCVPVMKRLKLLVDKLRLELPAQPPPKKPTAEAVSQPPVVVPAFSLWAP